MADGYGMDDAIDRLNQAVQALEDAQPRMAASMKRAAYWRDEYAGHGLAGLGHSCEQIRAAAEIVDDQAGGLLATIGTHVATAARVTDTTEPDQVIATLAPVERALGEISAECRAAANRCADLAALVARSLEGGKPEWLIKQAENAGQDFNHARGHVNAVTRLISDAIHRARDAGTTVGVEPMVPSDREAGTHTGMPEPTLVERAGHRVVHELPDSRSDRERFRNESVRKAGDTTDAITNMTTIVREGLGAVRPTGQHTTPPRDTYAQQNPSDSAMSDPILGAAAGVAMIFETVRLVKNAKSKARRRKNDGDDATV